MIDIKAISKQRLDNGAYSCRLAHRLVYNRNVALEVGIMFRHLPEMQMVNTLDTGDIQQCLTNRRQRVWCKYSNELYDIVIKQYYGYSVRQ